MKLLFIEILLQTWKQKYSITLKFKISRSTKKNFLTMALGNDVSYVNKIVELGTISNKISTSVNFKMNENKVSTIIETNISLYQ